MTLLLVLLLIVASIVLGLIVLIQNPKGGGLSGSIAGFSSQFMGVKQTTDVLEKGTWVFTAIICVLCIFSSFFIPKTAVSGQPDNTSKASGATVPVSTPATPPAQPSNAVPFNPSQK